MKIIKFVDGGNCCDCFFYSDALPFCDLSQHNTGDVFLCVECFDEGGETICVNGNFILEDNHEDS